MLNRCRSRATGSWEWYGAEGVTVCERWLNFENFVADMGERPGFDYSLERKQLDRGYEPDNCIWLLKRLQARNKRTTLWVEMSGERKCLAEWAELYQRNYGKLYHFVRKRGLSLAAALQRT